MKAKEKRERALAIVDDYCLYHCGTAITVGFMGGQFGADTYALSALTIAMIEKICNVYGIKNRAAKNVHIARALGRLTIRGTAIARAILNYIPMGCIANGATSYFLTRGAGIQCIDEIEKEQMNMNSQLILGAKDIAVTTLKGTLGEYIEDSTSGICDDALEKVKDALDLDLTKDLGADKIIEAINSIPITAEVGIDKAIGTTLKNALIASIQGDLKKIGSPDMIRDLLYKTVTSMIAEEARMSQAEIQFRLTQKDEHFKVFDEFLVSTSKHFDEINKERGTLEAIRYVISALSDGLKLHFELTPKDMVNKILDNPYDKAIEHEYSKFLPIINDSSTMESLLAKASVLYYRLIAVNYLYHLPNISFDKVDDKLSNMISGRIRSEFGSFDIKSDDYLAYLLSEFIRNHQSYLAHRIPVPILLIDSNIRELEYKENYERTCTYWGKLIKTIENEQDLWSVGNMVYMQLFKLDSMRRTGSWNIYKDDNLVYKVSEFLKYNNNNISKYTTEQVAYFISEYYDNLPVH